MEFYIIISILVLIIVLLIIILFKSKKNNNDELNVTARLGKFETSMTKNMGDFQINFGKELRSDFDKLNEKIEERLSKIDEAQKKIDGLSTEIVSLQSVLTDKKTRGIFGEVNLNYILTSVFGDNNSKIYDIQHHMSNGSIADAILYAPEPLGTICIDSKFPLENYQKMTDKKLTNSEREAATKLFKSDVKKHIEAISSKYIILNETADQAIMFLPAEAIFAEINAYHTDLLEYAYKNKVWITSPTTLMSTLSIIQMILKNMERDKYAKIIHVELNKLSIEFDKYRARWDKLAKNISVLLTNESELYLGIMHYVKTLTTVEN